MAWNEPGNNNNDPWKNRGGKDQGPPDLDELFKDLGNRFNGLFGGKPSNKGGSAQGPFGLGLIAIIAVIVWALSGIYTVKEAENGVMLTFGQYTHDVGPGIQWKATFVQKVIPVNIQTIRTVPASGFMLTEDENVVQVEMEVQYLSLIHI